LDKRYGGTHTIGSAGNEYKDFQLLGAVDIGPKRYARLQGHMGRRVCVPWIDAFAELVGHKISVVWGEETTGARTFRVNEADGFIEDEEYERRFNGVSTIGDGLNDTCRNTS